MIRNKLFYWTSYAAIYRGSCRTSIFFSHVTFAIRIFTAKIRVVCVSKFATRILTVEIRVANFEMHTARISAIKIRVTNVKCEKKMDVLYEPR